MTDTLAIREIEKVTSMQPSRWLTACGIPRRVSPTRSSPRQASDALSDQVSLDPNCHSNIVVKSTTEIIVLVQSLIGRAPLVIGSPEYAKD